MFCFHGTASVTVQAVEDKNSNKILLRDLKLGDKVLVDSDGSYETRKLQQQQRDDCYGDSSDSPSDKEETKERLQR